MKNTMLLALIVLSTFISNAQVGIRNTNPKSSLDISASSIIAPNSDDGLLVPRIDKFPTTNPIVDQNSMMVYLNNNLTATNINGTAKNYDSGFYYWDNAQTDWINFNKESFDADWYVANTIDTSFDIVDNIFTKGLVGIGHDDPISDLDIRSENESRAINVKTVGARTVNVTGFYNELGTETTAANTEGIRTRIITNDNSVHFGFRNELSGNGFGTHRAVFNLLSGNGTGSQYGIENTITNKGDANHYGVNTILSGIGSGIKYGVRNTMNAGTGAFYGVHNQLSGSGDGVMRGTNNNINNSGNGGHFGVINNLFGTGSGTKYGSFNVIATTAGGQHYGVFSKAEKAGAWAGYFLGNVRVSQDVTVLGQVTANNFVATTAADKYADYVFEKYFNGFSEINKDYSFLSIEDAQEYVKTNGHLKGITSYEKVKANNFKFNLSDLSLSLLEKTEEQFLYITELNKKIKSADEVIQSQDQKIKSLEERLLKIEAFLEQ